MNHPKDYNAITPELVEELNDKLEEIRSSNLKVVVVKGVGKSFSSGGNI